MNRSLIQRSISGLLVGLIFIFALSSFGNVREHIAKVHSGWTSWTLGGGFSVVVFVCAYLAATSKHMATRGWSIVVGTVFGVASGVFQYQLYVAGKADWVTAALLSFIPIVVGEVGLALVESSYSREQGEQQADAGQQELEVVRQGLAKARQELDDVRLDDDGRQTELENVRQELATLRTLANQLRKELNDFAPVSVVGRLNETQRQKMPELLRLVDELRVETPGDLIKHGMSKSDVYTLWPVATAARLVYPNGDGAYHVREA